jgi:glycosyltransferase involved in cell wall biosynthesis
MNTRIPDTPPIVLALQHELNRPLWSVMIPVYNCIFYLAETLKAVLKQDKGLQLMQIEVVDDCSTDGDVCALVQEIGNGRITYYRQETNRGSLRNFETCINRAQGHYVHLLHGDDLVEPGYYNKIEELFTNHPEAGAAFTDFNYIDHLGDKIAIRQRDLQIRQGIIPDFLYKIARKQLIQPPAIVVKRSVYEALGGFYAVHFGEDWEMWIRIASKFPVAYSPESLASYRVAHGIGISHNSFLTGQNIKDITKVINNSQQYLPDDKKAYYKKAASAYYALFCVRIANSLLLSNKEAALTQIRGAWNLHKSFVIALWIIRFYLMDILRYKQIENKIKRPKPIKHKTNILSF